MQRSIEPSVHYDRITDAWRYIFGDNFHFGYFKDPKMGLNQATDALVDALADLGEFSNESTVLDVGCGIGNPAFHLHEKYGCRITGISTSQRGIEIAKMSSEEKGISHNVAFQIADGTKNGFGAQSFDIVWVLESSHLMEKERLFSECHRVLKKGGQLLLCDLMLKKRPGIAEHFDYLARLKLAYPLGYLSMKKAFGRGKNETFDYYAAKARRVGFIGVEQIDVSDEVLPTLEHWRANMSTHRDAILKTFTPKQISDFIAASNLLEDFFRNGIHGYGLLKAVKP
ncbi:MAG: methyltransferase domain-containing protein [Deltaproteobacteria bacterium]|nr:methyltransferase domain-containing protein [Deltaproteobacteria bacterium]